jgi:BirA family biotin operon repressor/biotin-[acetyl-CoA-carboxylase] ligase
MSESPDGMPVRHTAIGLSVEALIQQWARQEAAPAGAAVVLDTEIAARRHGGVEWRPPDALAVSVLVRPTSLEPSRAEVAWAASGLGAARALDELMGGSHRCRWPAEIDGVAGCDIASSATTALGPGRVDFAALTARLAPVTAVGSRDEVADALVRHLRITGTALDDPNQLLTDYRAACGTLGHDAVIQLLPKGTVRGRAVTIDESGGLVLESRTGLREHVSIGSLASLDFFLLDVGE